jgi:hypothetical protein
MVVSRGGHSTPSIRHALLIAMALLTAGCRPTRTVTIGWDAPANVPDRYRVLVDDRVVLDIVPPPLDDRCNCLPVSVPVPARGHHTIRVVAYNRRGAAATSADLIVQ